MHALLCVYMYIMYICIRTYVCAYMNVTSVPVHAVCAVQVVIIVSQFVCTPLDLVLSVSSEHPSGSREPGIVPCIAPYS